MSERKRKDKAGHGSSKRRAVAADDLAWTDARLPDMLNDAEGFFGLEEVEDVEIVREGNQLRFISAKETENEFNGFSDDEKGDTAESERQSSTKPTATATKEAHTVTKKAKTKAKQNSQPQPSGNEFSALANTEETEIDLSAWDKLNLSDQLLSCLSKLGFSKPTPIQTRAVPEVIAGHDVIGKAATGSGKTLAFGIPIVERWLKQKTKALILSPTRELAHQITGHLKSLCAGLVDAPQVVSVTGGLSVYKQQRQLAKADIIIGTPGRLWEVMNSDAEVADSLQSIAFLVIDEADRLLTEGHFKEAEEIINLLSLEVDGEAPTRQTLVFSATFDRDLQHKLTKKTKAKGGMDYLLEKLKFNDPKFIDVNPVSKMAEGLREGIVECAADEKDLYLYSLLMFQRGKQTLVFTNSIHSVRRITPFLQNLNLPALSLHSQMPQKARLRSLERFSSGGILIATDVAARGLDISGVQLVIHYHVPRAADAYVHRSGRTARADSKGTSVLLCSPDEVAGVRRLVSKVHADSKSKYYMRTLDIDRRIVSRLKPRVTLSKKISDSMLAKEKVSHESNWLKNAAEELGVDYDSDEFEQAEKGHRGRGKDRRRKEKEAQQTSKAVLGALKAELKQLLAERVNTGVSERYPTSGTIDIDALLKGAKGEFLGYVNELDLDD